MFNKITSIQAEFILNLIIQVVKLNNNEAKSEDVQKAKEELIGK